MRLNWLAAVASTVFGTARGLAGAMFVLAAIAGSADAGGPPPPPSAPEIASASVGGALALLAGGMLMLTDRVRRK